MRARRRRTMPNAFPIPIDESATDRPRSRVARSRNISLNTLDRLRPAFGGANRRRSYRMPLICPALRSAKPCGYGRNMPGRHNCIACRNRFAVIASMPCDRCARPEVPLRRASIPLPNRRSGRERFDHAAAAIGTAPEYRDFSARAENGSPTEPEKKGRRADWTAIAAIRYASRHGRIWRLA